MRRPGQNRHRSEKPFGADPVMESFSFPKPFLWSYRQRDRRRSFLRCENIENAAGRQTILGAKGSRLNQSPDQTRTVG
jgi:hypothetical protein